MSCCFGEYLNVFAWLICGFCLFFAVGFVGCVFVISLFPPSEPPQYQAETPGFIQSVSVISVGGQRFSVMVVSKMVFGEPQTTMRHGVLNGSVQVMRCALSSA